MPKYLVTAKETVFYDYEVEAENEIQAKEMVKMGEVKTPEPDDSADFEVLEVEIINN